MKKRFTIKGKNWEELSKQLDPLKDRYGTDMACKIADDEKSADVVIVTEEEYWKNH